MKLLIMVDHYLNTRIILRCELSDNVLMNSLIAFNFTFCSAAFLVGQYLFLYLYNLTGLTLVILHNTSY